MPATGSCLPTGVPSTSATRAFVKMRGRWIRLAAATPAAITVWPTFGTLYTAREILAYRLNTIHNLHYFVNLVKAMRAAILAGTFDQFKNAFYSKRLKHDFF
jgi:hypothetical protein